MRRGLKWYVLELESDVLWTTVAALEVARLHAVVERRCVEDNRPWPCPTLVALRPILGD